MKKLTMILMMIAMMFVGIMSVNTTAAAKTTKVTMTTKKTKTVKTSKKIKKVKTSNKKVVTAKKTKSKAFKISAKSVKSVKTAKITVTFTNKSKKTYKVTVKPTKNAKTADNSENNSTEEDSTDNNTDTADNSTDSNTSADNTATQNYTPSRRVKNGLFESTYLTVVDGYKTSVARPGGGMGSKFWFYYDERFNTILYEYEDPYAVKPEEDPNDPTTWFWVPDTLVTTGYAPDDYDKTAIWNVIYNGYWNSTKTEEEKTEATNTEYNEYKDAYNDLAKQYGLDLVWE